MIGRKKVSSGESGGRRAGPFQRQIGRVIPIRPHESIPIRPRTSDIQIIGQWALHQAAVRSTLRLRNAKGTNLNNHNYAVIPGELPDVGGLTRVPQEACLYIYES